MKSATPYATELVRFLALHLGVSTEEIPVGGNWTASGNTIGSLALRLGVLSLEEVEQVIDLQLTDGQRFGEVAERLGYLNSEEVEGLLALQCIHRWLDLTGPFVLSGKVGIEPLLTALVEFAREQSLLGVGPCSREGLDPQG